MTRLKTFLLFLSLTLSQTTFGCECAYYKAPFLTVAPQTQMTALVKIKRYLTHKDIYDVPTPMSMEVEIIEIYRGEEKRKTVTVWGDNGVLCRPYLSEFEPGKDYVIAFDRADDGLGRLKSEERTTDYAIGSCGHYWLTVDIDKSIATGAVTDKLKEIKLSDLKFELAKKLLKVEELSRDDLKKIFQLAFDLPTLQDYYHIDVDTTRKQIYVQNYRYDGAIEDVVKFGKQLKVIYDIELREKKINNYFVISEWVHSQNYVRFELEYVGEGVTVTYEFKKNSDKWEIVNHTLTER